MSTPVVAAKVQTQPEITPIPLMQLATAFWAFKTLATAVDMDLFTHLSSSPMSAPELARWFNIEERPAEMLLTGCAGLGLLEKQDGRYRNTPLADTFLARSARYYCGGFVTMLNRRLYSGWDKLPDAVRTNKPTTWDPDKQKSLFEGADPTMMATFWQAMHSLSIFTARALGEAVDFSGFRKLLDVGGGSGAFDIELCRRYPNLSATVYDLPFVTEIAAGKIVEAGLGGRIATKPGDFFTDAQFPAGYDVILLSMIMHDWSEADDRAILRKCYEALPKGGAVVISELLVNDDKTGPAPAALMSLNMLVETVGGRNYTPAEYSAWLNEVGFRDVRVVWFEAAGANGARSDTNANSRPRNRGLWRGCASRAATHNYPNRRLLRRSPDYLRPPSPLHLPHLQDEQPCTVRSNFPKQEIFVHRRFAIVASLLIFLSMSLGCSTKPLPSEETSDNSAEHKTSSWFGKKEMTLPAGTLITVRLANPVGSKLSNSGDQFSASVATPVEVDGKVVVPSGAEASGKVVQAVPLGRFKGGAVLKLALDSLTINGDAYDVKTSSVSRYLKGKGKRTAAMIGGGAGGGALIGGLAGGGKGALIGAALGAGAGTAGAAYTGNKEIILPAESTLSFKLTEPLTVKM